MSESEPSSAMIISVGRCVCSNTESTDNSSASFQLKVVMMSDIFNVFLCSYGVVVLSRKWIIGVAECDYTLFLQ